MCMYVSDVVDTSVSKISLLTRIIISVLFQNINIYIYSSIKATNKWIFILFGYYFYQLILSMVSVDNWFMINKKKKSLSCEC
jgi:hypothetical protein